MLHKFIKNFIINIKKFECGCIKKKIKIDLFDPMKRKNKKEEIIILDIDEKTLFYMSWIIIILFVVIAASNTFTSGHKENEINYNEKKIKRKKTGNK